MATLAPELANFTDEKIEIYLKANVKPVFPTVLAVAKVRQGYYRYGSEYGGFSLAPIVGPEAEGWQKLTGLRNETGKEAISQVHFVNRLLLEGTPTLKHLRDAAALVHAPLLLVYLETENASQGYNSAAIAYWTIVGLFTVPGNTVGQYTVAQAILVDTRTGVILATAQSDSTREENVLPGAVDIARDRVQKQTQTDAVAGLQKDVRRALVDLATPDRPAKR